MILLLDSVITPYAIARYNEWGKSSRQKLLVWFQTATEKLRDWHSLPDANFQYEVIPSHTGHWLGKDVISFRWHYGWRSRLQPIAAEVDRVIIIGWDSLLAWQLLWWGKQHHKRLTLYAGSTENESGWLRTLTLPLVKWYVRQFDDFLSYGTASSQYLANLGAPKNKIYPFYNAVDNDFFVQGNKHWLAERSLLRHKLGIADSDFALMTNGRMVGLKNFNKLIDVVQSLLSEHPELHLILVGDGPLRAELEKSVASKYKFHIHFVGYVQHQDLPQYYTIADGFILPSQQEVWGLVVNEAMASGIPVAASNRAGCVSDLIKDNQTGWSFAPTNDGLYKIIRKMLTLAQTQPAAYHAIGHAAQEYIQKFSTVNNVNNIEKHWRTLYGEK